ncbi:uncharacterized protein LOC112538537 [Tetranychus urticae]|nr:uncharacterized protein LOC112538537 [Tetranychus urticae]
MYSLAVRASVHLEDFARFEIAHLYTIATISNFTNIYTIYGENSSLRRKLISCLFMCGDAVYIIYITIIMMRVNTVSYEESETLYELSLLNEPDNLNREIELFLYRVSKNDVGFTFLNLFVINPSFISSVITLFTTFILTLPSLY